MVITYIDNDSSMLCVNSDSFVLLSADVIACVIMLVYFYFLIFLCAFAFVWCICRSILFVLRTLSFFVVLLVEDNCFQWFLVCFWLIAVINMLFCWLYSCCCFERVCSVLCVFYFILIILGWSGSSPFTR